MYRLQRLSKYDIYGTIYVETTPVLTTWLYSAMSEDDFEAILDKCSKRIEHTSHLTEVILNTIQVITPSSFNQIFDIMLGSDPDVTPKVSKHTSEYINEFLKICFSYPDGSWCVRTSIADIVFSQIMRSVNVKFTRTYGSIIGLSVISPEELCITEHMYGTYNTKLPHISNNERIIDVRYGAAVGKFNIYEPSVEICCYYYSRIEVSW